MTHDDRLARLEDKIDALAEQLTALDKRQSRTVDVDVLARLDIRLRLNKLEASVNDIHADVYVLENVAHHAFFATAPKAMAGLDEMIDAVDPRFRKR